MLRLDISATSWESLIMSYANNKGADHPRSLISAFVVRCLDSPARLTSLWSWAGRFVLIPKTGFLMR